MDDRDGMEHPRVVRSAPGGATRSPSPLRVLALVMLLSVLALLALAACAPGSAATSTSTQPVPTGNAPASTFAPRATGTPSATPIAISDLNAFRQQLSSSFSSNTWAKVSPLLSPNFSFVGTDSTAARFVMPASASDFKKLYTTQGPWGQSSQYEVDIRDCISGPTPSNQLMGFDGGGGSFILVGMGHWQGYWVVAWAYQDPLGGYNACAHE